MPKRKTPAQEGEELLEELKAFYGVKTKYAVIRRSLAIARAAKAYIEKDLKKNKK